MIQKKSQDREFGRIKQGFILDIHYPRLVKDCSKIECIARVLAFQKHRGAAALVMFSFPEFLLVLERVSSYPLLGIASLMVEVQPALCSEHLEILLMMPILTDFFYKVPT